MGYSTASEVRKLIKDDDISNILGLNEYIEEETERESLITPIIEEAIKDADGEIDGYLNKRYSTPLSSVPKVLNKFSKDIAIYNIYSRIGIDEDEREKTLLTRYKNATKFLENVAKGLIDIGIEKLDKKAANGFNVNSNTRLFSRNSMREM